ncbi:MAG: hypothetical protein MR016_09610 [Agathobacter sp.]|nr:hypothetical protein [Agathobacter sp.]
MKNKKIYALFLVAACVLCACGQEEKADTHKIQTDYGNVRLCDYSALTADEIVYEITDEDVDEEIDNLLNDYIQYTPKDSAEDGDYVEVYMTAVADGNVLFEYPQEEGDTYEILLGYNEFGAEFDEKLLGVSAGDELEFDVTYGQDYEDDVLAGQTVNYQIKVDSVVYETEPQLTDEFVTETLGYSSVDDMRAQIKDELSAYYNSNSVSNAKEELLQEVVENSDCSDYSKDLYQEVKAQVEDSYAEYMEPLGVSTLDGVYDAFEMTSEDIDEEITNRVYRMMAVYAIAKEQNIEITDAEYEAGLERYAAKYTQDDAQEYTTADVVAKLGEAQVRYKVLEDKVLDYLYANAAVTQVVGVIDSDEEEAEETAEE